MENNSQHVSLEHSETASSTAGDDTLGTRTENMSGIKKKAPLKNRMAGPLARKPPPKWNVYPLIDVNEYETNRLRKFPSNQIYSTKYTLLNFLPKNLFEQFRRATNMYFLLICIITLIPTISPLTPYTSISPLVAVLLVSAVKEAYEDYLRARSDRDVNNRKFTVVLPSGEERPISSKDIKVGMVLKITKNQTFPADLVFLSSSLNDGICFVETSQLDGESNLKMLKCLPQTAHVRAESASTFRAVLECEEPHNHLYTFRGKISLLPEKKTLPLDIVQLLLRGAGLRNTDWVLGVVAYAGPDTKLSKNQKEPPSKFSTIEKQMNNVVLGIFLFQLGCVIILTIAGGIWQGQTGHNMWYLNSLADQSVAWVTFLQFFAYFVLLSFLIPMSMMVTLEVIKVIQTKLMDWDEQMRIVKNDPDTGMNAKTSNLNDELGLVKYVFSDKTGTLTDNHMEFAKSSIRGHVFERVSYGELRDALTQEKWVPGSEADAQQQRIEFSKPDTASDRVGGIVDFLRCLALCQSATVEEDATANKKIRYNSQSPDEVALCQAALENDFAFRSRRTEGVMLTELDAPPRVYALLNVMEFSSARARMSVIVRTPEGQIVMYSKGADSVMRKRLRDDEKDLVTRTQDHIDLFSREGLRTLILAKRLLTQEEYDAFNKDYERAANTLKNRETLIEEINDRMERNLILIGSTAIEDRLQEGVPETIDYLLRCGIKVWMITGDKQETALNIGKSTNLLRKGLPIVKLNAVTTEECQKKLEKAVSRYADAGKEIGLVIDGGTLIFALREHAPQLLRLSKVCCSVVCCRVTPLQKAQIVQLVRHDQKDDITLAIGDGANDVSMIQVAHVGIGIYGKEGTQAARASDYAIRRFRHLRRLLTVHGRYSYLRNAGAIHQSLYKNLAFFFVQFWFAFFCGISGQTVYSDWIVTFFNITFTSAPPWVYGFMDKDLSEEIITRHPEAYKEVQSGRHFTKYTVCAWMLSAFYHSFVIYFHVMAFFSVNDIVFPSTGQPGDFEIMAHIASTTAFLIVITRLALAVNYWNSVSVVFFLLSIYLGYFLTLAYISASPVTFPATYFVINRLASLAVCYLLAFLGMAVALLPDIIFKYFRRLYFPLPSQILQELYSNRDEGFVFQEEKPAPVVPAPSHATKDSEIVDVSEHDMDLRRTDSLSLSRNDVLQK